MKKMDLKQIAFLVLGVILTIAYFYSFVIPDYEKDSEEKAKQYIKETVKKIDSAKQDKANKQEVILNQSTETRKESKRLIDALPPVTPTWIESDTMLQDKIDYIITYKPQE